MTALVLAPGCSKDNNSPKDEMPSWVTDLTKAVPIILGTGPSSGVKTKAAITSLSDVEFGVLALDIVSKDELFRTEVARGGASEAQFFSKTNGANITKYYPLYNPDGNNYSFFAWHTSDTKVASQKSIFDLDEGTYTKTFEIGQVDVLWAKADATPFVVNEITYNGFNAEYQRTARKYYSSTFDNYLPKLTFKHLTAALHFMVVAEDADAAATFINIKDNEELVHMTDLKIYSVSESGIPAEASLDVISGELTTVSQANNLAIAAEEPLLPEVTAHEFGAGLFIMPTSENLRVQFTLNVPTGNFTPTDGTGVGYPLNAPEGGFVAGKSYTYKIIIRSLEDISIKLDLEEWIDAEIDDNVIATIG